jgi:hypothetical protein
MPERKRKSKIVSIRLSLEEYESFKAISPSLGVRSISAFARSAMGRLLEIEPVNGELRPVSVNSRFQDLENKLNALREEVTRLSRIVGGQ